MISRPIYNNELLEVCKIDGEYCIYCDSYTKEQIIDVINRCEEYLEYGAIRKIAGVGEFITNKQLNIAVLRPLTSRQICCAENSMGYIIGEYEKALHEFIDTIDDYGKGRKNKIISVNEYGIYMTIIRAFKEKLRSE